MSNYPTSLDDDTTLPIVNDNLTEIGGDAINALRDAVFNIEQALGTGIAGTTPSLAARLGVFINPDGGPKSSVLTSLGLVTLPITNGQIADNAGVPESKLHLDYRTQDLFNYIRDLSRDVNTALGWISISGVKLEPHLLGVIYRHDLGQIDVASNSAQFLNNKFRSLRDNSTAYTLISDINNELLAHQWADGSPFGTTKNIITNNGSTYPSNYAHLSSGIFLNSSTFSTIPQTVQDVQTFVEYIDSASIFLFGTRIQNFYANGVSRTSRSSQLNLDGYGQSIIPSTPATAYLSTVGSPVDDISTGDDVIQFNPAPNDGYAFDEKFALVKIGDIIRINYGTIEVPFVIKEKKYIQQAGSRIFEVRIAGKNLFNTTTAVARIDKPLFNNNKFGVLATSPANNVFTGSITPSVIVGSPRGAQAIGIGFDADNFDNTHYLLYLALFPTGNPLDGYTILPAIDVTGNSGATPGMYTLDSIVQSTNDAFRKPGYNYRFIAFQYNGEFGIMLADSYSNAGFSIINGVVNSSGLFDPITIATNFANNVVGVFPPNLSGTFTVNNGSPSVATTVSQVGVVVPGDTIIFSPQKTVTYTVSTVSASTIVLTANYTGTNSSSATATLPNVSIAPDPLGFGSAGANIASPPFLTSYSSAEAALNPTRLFIPLKRNTYYVNGTEREKLTLEVGQVLDNFGDGYWVATIDGYNVIPGSRVEVTYSIPLDLSTSLLKAGKTIVVQGLGKSTLIDAGRFIIKDITIGCAPNESTKITVWDAVHATGISPYAISPIGTKVGVYFNSDSVTFNKEALSDVTSIGPFKRYFETYIDQDGKTFTHERSRINISGGTLLVGNVSLYTYSELAKLNILHVSHKLRGYQFGNVNKITLHVNLNATVGAFDGYLCSFDGVNYTHKGPDTFGFLGQRVRIYDESNIDYIDILFDINASISTFVKQNIDFQLFPTLSLDDEVMLISTCQLNDITNNINYLQDERQFGNTSENNLTTSALDYIALPEKELHSNGVVRGFDLETYTTNPVQNQIYLTGGVALVSGKLIQMNPETVSIPILQELNSAVLYNINWALCVNDKGEYQTIPLIDFDPVLNTPSTSLRVFNVFNPINSTNYNLESSSFLFLASHRKDLTILYIVASTVGVGPTISLNVIDARKYVGNANSVAPIVWSSDTIDGSAADGNFRSLQSVLTWIKYHNTFNNLVKLRGNLTFTNQIDLTGFITRVEFVGEGATLELSSNNGIIVGNNVTFRNIHFKYGPSIGISDGYVHSGNGCIYANLSAADLSNIVIEDCTFSMNDQSNQQHPPFVSFEINSGFTLKDVYIRNNRFVDSVGNTRGHTAIAAVHNLLGSGTNPAAVKNLFIENNDCDDQMIIVSSFADVTVKLTGLGLIASNVQINNNSCGAIGVITSLTATTVSELNTPRLVTINNNKCKLIAGLDGAYTFIPDRAVVPTYGIGNIIADGNSCHWIHLVGQDLVASTQLADLKIVNNSLTANDATFLNSFYLSNLGAFRNAAIMILSDYGTANETSAFVISGNIINSGVYNGVTYKYILGGISSGASSIVSNNIIRGIGPNSLAISLVPNSVIASPVRHHIVQGNHIYRGSETIVAYVAATGTVNDTGLCVDNFFDSTTVDGSNTTLVVITVTTNWIVERNINQTAAIKFTSNIGQIGIRALGTATPVVAGIAPNITASFVTNQDQISFSYKDPTVHQFVDWFISIDGILPTNCKLISASVVVNANPVTGSTETASMWFTSDSLGPSVLTSVDFTAHPPSTDLTLTHSAPGYTSNDRGFIVVELDILHATLNVGAAIKTLLITYRWV